MKKIVLAAASLMLATGVSVAQSDALFSYKGKDYAVSDLDPALQQAYFENSMKAWGEQQSVADRAVLEIYAAAQAEEQGKSIEDVREQMLAVDEVAETEIKAFYEAYKDRIGAPLEQVRGMIVQQLSGMKTQEKLGVLLQQIKAKNGFEMKLAEPQSPVFDIDVSLLPGKGADTPKVTLVEFADYRCGYCKRAAPEVKKLAKKYADDLRVYYADFPVIDKPSGISQALMAGGYCAREQDKFWEYQDAVYNWTAAADKSTPATVAGVLQLDMDQFSQCMSEPEALAYVDDVEALGRTYGVSGTPSFFLDGQRVNLDQLDELIAEALEGDK